MFAWNLYFHNAAKSTLLPSLQHSSLCLQSDPMCVCVCELQIRAWQPLFPGETHLSRCSTPTPSHTHTSTVGTHWASLIWKYTTFWNLFQLFMSFSNNFAPFCKCMWVASMYLYVCKCCYQRAIHICATTIIDINRLECAVAKWNNQMNDIHFKH